MPVELLLKRHSRLIKLIKFDEEKDLIVPGPKSKSRVRILQEELTRIKDNYTHFEFEDEQQKVTVIAEQKNLISLKVHSNNKRLEVLNIDFWHFICLKKLTFMRKGRLLDKLFQNSLGAFIEEELLVLSRCLLG